MPGFDEHPDLVAAGAALRHVYAEDQRERADEALAARRHARTLADVCAELMARGETVTVAAAGVTWTGPVVDCGPDRLRLQVAIHTVDVHLGARVPPVLRTSGRVEHPGSSAGSGLDFRGRLLELEATARPVRVGLADGPVVGTCTVGRDVVSLTIPDAVVHAPLGALAWVHAAAGPA